MKSLLPGRALLALAVFAVAGCETRSISNSDFDHNQRYGAPPLGGYAGELSELDVLGVRADAAISDADIQAALRQRTEPKLSHASKVLLIQSGADFPDAPMLDALRQRFTVAAFSGKPATKPGEGAGYAKALRLAAARGGYDHIVCYWGVLESARKNKITSAVSWVPIVGFMIPDEREDMRIRLKAAIIDVASGNWTLVNPVPASTSSLSTVLSRRTTDQELVAKLKEVGYQNLVAALEEHTG
jgi:hypothetical protein